MLERLGHLVVGRGGGPSRTWSVTGGARGRTAATGDDQPAHLAARPARHRRRGRHERLRHRARQAARRGAASRSTSSPAPPAPALDQVVAACDGVTVRHIHAGPFEGLTKDELPGPALRLRPRGAAHRGGPAARPLRPRAQPLLALRPGRGAGPRPLGRPAGALDAHDGQGQERRPRRRRRPRAAGPGDRRGAGGRGRRHAHRQHRPRGQAADRALRRRPGAGSRWSTQASTSTSSGRVPTRRPLVQQLGLPADADVLLFAGRIQPLKAPDVLLRAVAPRCSSASRAAAPGSWSRSSAARPGTGPRQAAVARRPRGRSSGSTDVVRFVPPVSPGRAGPVVRRRDAGRRAVVQRVVRAGRGRGRGDRHPGHRRRGRRPDHGGPRRPQRPARRRPRAPTTGPTRCSGSSSTTRCAPG